MKILEENDQLGRIVPHDLEWQSVLPWDLPTERTVRDVLHHKEKTLLVLNKLK